MQERCSLVKLLTKEQKRSLSLAVGPFIGSLFIRFLYFSNKKVFHSPEYIDNIPIIFAFWHGELLMAPYAYIKKQKKPTIKVLISEHFDGELIAKTMSYFGFGTVRGSSARGGAKALISSLKELRNGTDIAVTPDGPKGPRHEVQDGIIIMAQKTKTKIVFVEVKPTKFWQLASWDKFIIPKPFGIINFYISEPVSIEGLDMQDAREFIRKGLLKHEC